MSNSTPLQLVCMWIGFSGVVCAQDRIIPVSVTAKVEPAIIQSGKPIPLSITVANDLSDVIGFSSYSLTPNKWNGETTSITLVDINRDGDKQSLFLHRPKVEVPIEITAVRSHRIESDENLTIETHANKWKIVDGWIPGKYTATVRVEGLTVDGNRCILSVHSEPFEFEVR